MEKKIVKKKLRHLLFVFSNYVTAIWVYSPGIIFLFLAWVIFLKLDQGTDIIYQSVDPVNSAKTGFYLVLATLFWVFTSWYTARIIAYDRDDLYKNAKELNYQFPRLIPFCIFLILWLATFRAYAKEHKIDIILRQIIVWGVIVAEVVLYFLIYIKLEKPLLAQIKGGNSMSGRQFSILSHCRKAAWAAIIAGCLLIILGWYFRNIYILMFTLPFIQFGFLYLLVFRYPRFRYMTPASDLIVERAKQAAAKGWLNAYFTSMFNTAFPEFRYAFEKQIFKIYHYLAAAAVFVYLCSVFFLSFARELTTLPFLMLAFGVLLGLINLIALLSHRHKIKVWFIIAALIYLGSFRESHKVRKIDTVDTSVKVYAKRDSFLVYLRNWISWHKDSLDKYSGHYPVYFTLADGGASRSGYWVASVLARLHEETRYQQSSHNSYFLDRLLCLSGASGGSVGNAAFLAAYAVQQKNPQLKTDELCRNYLANDFLVYPLTRLLGPDLVRFPLISYWEDRAGALEHGMDYAADKNDPVALRMRSSFSDMLPNQSNKFPILSINTTRVNDGTPGVVCTIDIDRPKAVFGERIDVLNLLGEGEDIRVSTAAALGARFPYMSPGGKIGNNSYFVDGGYFDNSGTGIVHEMLLELAKLQKDKTDTFLYKYVNKMDFYVIHISNTPQGDTTAGKKEKINPVINDLATPLLTLAGSYSSQTNINDARLTNYLQDLNNGNKAYIVFNLYRSDTTETFPMNWVISKRALSYMDNSLKNQVGLRDLINEMKRGQKEELFNKIVIGLNKSR